MMTPGTMKDRPQAEETQTPAMSDPKMLPTEVCEFQMPMIKPLLAGREPGWHHRGGCPGSTGMRMRGGHAGETLTFPSRTSSRRTPRRRASRSSAPARWRPGKRQAASRGGGGTRWTPAPFWAAGLKNSHPHPESVEKMLGLAGGGFFCPAGAIPEPFASFPWLNWERLALPNGSARWARPVVSAPTLRVTGFCVEWKCLARKLGHPRPQKSPENRAAAVKPRAWASPGADAPARRWSTRGRGCSRSSRGRRARWRPRSAPSPPTGSSAGGGAPQKSHCGGREKRGREASRVMPPSGGTARRERGAKDLGTWWTSRWRRPPGRRYPAPRKARCSCPHLEKKHEGHVSLAPVLFSLPSFPRPRGAVGLRAWPDVIGVGTRSHPGPDFTTRCCPLPPGARGRRKLLNYLRVPNEQPAPCQNLRPWPGSGHGGEPVSAAVRADFGVIGKGGTAQPYRRVPSCTTCCCWSRCGGSDPSPSNWGAAGSAGVGGGEKGWNQGAPGTPCPLSPRLGGRSELTLTMLMGFRERW